MTLSLRHRLIQACSNNSTNSRTTLNLVFICNERTRTPRKTQLASPAATTTNTTRTDLKSAISVKRLSGALFRRNLIIFLIINLTSQNEKRNSICVDVCKCVCARVRACKNFIFTFVKSYLFFFIFCYYDLTFFCVLILI